MGDHDQPLMADHVSVMSDHHHRNTHASSSCFVRTLPGRSRKHSNTARARGGSTTSPRRHTASRSRSRNGSLRIGTHAAVPPRHVQEITGRPPESFRDGGPTVHGTAGSDLSWPKGRHEATGSRLHGQDDPDARPRSRWLGAGSRSPDIAGTLASPRQPRLARSCRAAEASPSAGLPRSPTRSHSVQRLTRVPRRER